MTAGSAVRPVLRKSLARFWGRFFLRGPGGVLGAELFVSPGWVLVYQVQVHLELGLG